MNTTPKAPKLLPEAQNLPRPGAESLMDALRRAHERLDRLTELADPLHISANRGRFTDEDANRLRDVLVRLGDLQRYYAEVERIAAHSDEFGPTFDAIRRPVAHWQTEHALWSWRLGEHDLSRVASNELRPLYEDAIQRGVEALRDATTMPALVQQYFSRGYERWLPGACGHQHDGVPLWHHIVREVAFWRRCQQLVAELPPSQVNDDQ